MAVILGIETSCDDTAAAVYADGQLLSNIVSSQLPHAQYGGVIPELAGRLHQVYINPVVEQALAQAHTPLEALDAIAFTQGPGLLGSLLVGAGYAKGLALGLNIPLVAVNHLQGHIFSLFIEGEMPQFPFLCMTVSGGHTEIALVHDYFHAEIIGRTLDDAAGEAFDKTAKLLGFPYPGGPLMDKHAVGGDMHFHRFPTPELPGLDFSFSGIKTAVLYYLRAQVAENPNFIAERLPDLCASIQHCIVDYLIKRLHKAIKHTGVKEVGIVGGVSANSALRERFDALCLSEGIKGYIPRLSYSTDNAAMIAVAGYHLYKAGVRTPLDVMPYATGQSA